MQEDTTKHCVFCSSTNLQFENNNEFNYDCLNCGYMQRMDLTFIGAENDLDRFVQKYNINWTK